MHEINLPFDSAVASFYLATGFGVEGSSQDMPDPYQPQILVELPGNIARAIIGQKHCPILPRHNSHPGQVHCLLNHVNQ